MAQRYVGERHYIRNLPIPVLKAVDELGGSGSRGEIAEKVIANEQFGEEVLSIIMPDGKTPEVHFCIGWTLSHLKKLGALDNSTRGVWSLTPKGRNCLTEAPEQLWRAVELAWKDFYASRRASKKEGGSTEIHDDSDPEDVDSEARQDWRADLLQTLHGLRPEVFERLAQRILRESGFTKVEVLGKSGDGGLDGVGVLRVALLSFPVYFQCKRYKPGSTVSSGEVRDFRGALAGRGEKGLFITTASFTNSARQEATRDGVIAIDLIDGDALCDLLSSLGLGVKKEIVEQVSVDADWFNSL